MSSDALNTPAVAAGLRTTRYFLEQVLRKRPYLPTDRFAAILAAPLHRRAQTDGRIRYWGRATDPRDGQ